MLTEEERSAGKEGGTVVLRWGNQVRKEREGGQELGREGAAAGWTAVSGPA